MSVWGIVVAAGVGTRFGGPKHQLLLAGRPLWQWARDALLEGGVAEVIIVGPVPGGVPGGPRRRDSVAAGLAQVPESVRYVLIHDAARPLASAALVRRVLDRLVVGDVAGVVPGLPVRDTLKEVSDERVSGTVDRSRLISVQTPQGFTTSDLRVAHAAGDEDASDDALLVERQGGTIVWVEGEPGNLKLTYPEDLPLLEALHT